MADQRNAFKWELAGALTVGAGKDRWQAPFNGQVLGTNAVVGTAPTGASLIIDVLKNGTSIYTTAAKPTIPAGGTSAPLAVPDDPASRFATGDVLSLSVTQVGATVAGADIDVQVEYTTT